MKKKIWLKKKLLEKNRCVQLKYFKFQTFAEEEFDSTLSPISAKMVNLKPNGSTISVTDENKLEYLDLIAQHRLCTRIKEQTEQVSLVANNFHQIPKNHFF